MKSRKLTVSLKDSIVESMLENWDASNEEPKITRTRGQIQSDLAMACRKEVYGKYDFSLLPEDFFNRECKIMVMFPNDSVVSLEYPRDKDGYRQYLPATRDSKVELVIKEGDKFFKEYQESLETLKTENEAYNKHIGLRDKFSSEVRQVLDSVNMTKQLIEVWPEVENHLPPEVKDPSAIQLPSVNLQELTNQLK